MKNSEKNITTLEELEQLIQMERLEDRLEMAQLIVLSELEPTNATSKNDCMCGNSTTIDIT